MHFDDTPEGDLAFNIMGDFAAYERALIRKRSITGKLRRVEEGIQPSRAMRLFGYHIVTENDVISGRYPAEELGKYHVIQEEAAWVRGMLQRYAAGASMRSIARWLQESGVPTHRGASHRAPETVTGIIRNLVYRGLATFGKRERRVDPGAWTVWLLSHLPREQVATAIADLQDSPPQLHYAISLLWSFVDSWIARLWEPQAGPAFPSSEGLEVV
jgi:hypothetical protein